MRLTATHRPLCLALCVAVPLLSGCRTTVKEHDAVGAAPSVTVKPFYQDDQGAKHYVGGLDCQLALKPEGQEAKLAASGTTSTEGPLLLGDLTPGRYRLVIRQQETRQETEEFRVRPGRRVTVRVRVDATPGKTIERVLGGIGKGVAFVLVGTGYLILKGLVFGFEIGDDEEEEEDD